MGIDKEAIVKYLQMFKVSVIILAVTLVVAIVLLIIAVPKITDYVQNNKKLKEMQASVGQKQAELAKIKDDIAREEAEKLPDNEMKTFYKDIKNTGSITSDILAGEVQEINDLIKYYGIKIYKINYTYDPEDDTFYKGKKEKYSVCKMDLDLFSNYMKFQGFMKDLYKHEHFLDIRSVEVVPYKKDKSILNIKLSLSLYAEKDGTAAPSQSQNSKDENEVDNASNEMKIDF